MNPIAVSLDLLGRSLSLIGWKGIDALAWILAFLSFDVLRIRRKMVLSNLKKALGPSQNHRERRRIARTCYKTFAATSLEFLASKWLFSSAQVQLLHPERLSDALAAGKGAFVMCIHMGNWELMCHMGSKHFAPVHVVVKPIGKGALANWVEETRRAIGFQLIDRKGSAMAATKQIFSALRQGEIVGFIVDQRRKGAVAPFFGHLSDTNSGLITLAQRQKAPIIPCTLIKTGTGRFEMEFFSPFELEIPSPESGLDFETHNATRMNACVENMIRKSPDQYFWLHNRWKGDFSQHPERQGSNHG